MQHLISSIHHSSFLIHHFLLDQFRPGHVPLGANRHDGFGRALAARIAELGSEARNVHIDGSRLDSLRANAPQARQQFFSRDGPFFVRHQKLSKAVSVSESSRRS